jgi:tyrosyl-tRNA synthetase
MKVIEVLADGVIFQSRGEARRAIAQGAVKINNTKVDDGEAEITKTVTTISKGKKVFVLSNGKVIGAQG